MKPFGMGLSAGYLPGAFEPPVGVGALVGAALDWTATAVEETDPLDRRGAGIEDDTDTATDEDDPGMDEEIGAATEEDDAVMVMTVVHMVMPLPLDSGADELKAG